MGFKAPTPPPAPAPPEPVRIPSPDDPELLAARRQKMQAEFKTRGGRASTQLSGADGAGGGQAYSRTTLG